MLSISISYLLVEIANFNPLFLALLLIFVVSFTYNAQKLFNISLPDRSEDDKAHSISED